MSNEPPYSTPYAPSGPLPPDPAEAGGKKLAAGLTGVLLGGLGVHKFVLGYTNAGAIMLATTLVCGIFGSCLVVPLAGAVVMCVIGLVEGIVYLTMPDEQFYRTYMVGKKEWF